LRLILWFTAATGAITAVVVLLLLRPMYRAGPARLIQRNSPQLLNVQQQLLSSEMLYPQHAF
jgi:hypothetical protein